MIGILTELERDRLVELVDSPLDSFALPSYHLENGIWDPTTEMDARKAQENPKLCLQSHNLVNHIRFFKRQLSKVLTEIDILQEEIISGLPGNKFPDEFPGRCHIESVGNQMKQRVLDIIIELDDKFDQCGMVIADMSLSMQTVRMKALTSHIYY